jgi:type VI secretion system protein ImpL
MKRILIGILIFVLYVACVIAGAFALHFSGTRLTLFCVVLGLLGGAAIVFALWYLRASTGETRETAKSDLINVNALMCDADRKLRTSRLGAKSLGSAQIIYILGEDNSAKTQTVLQSGLDVELLAGNLLRDGIVAPTQLANVWLAGSYVLVEAGGALLAQSGLWQQIIRATRPSRIGSVFSRSPRQPARAVVLCVSAERLPAPKDAGYSADQIRASAQTLNERLRQLSQNLGISVPVYVIFTKLDTLHPTHFADYVSRLTEEEVKAPLGTLLAAIEPGTGLYAERASRLISTRLDELIHAMSEFRLDVLSRGGEPKTLASAYEFPRDLQKRRDTIVDFLVELTRPSQLGINPFLRGFFFSGLRALVVEDVSAPVQPHTPAPLDTSATAVFSVGSAKLSQPQVQPQRSSSRKVPQWVFLRHLFSSLLLNDRSAFEFSRASTRTDYLKRTILASASMLILLILVLVTASFFNNHSLEQRLAMAAAAQVSPVPSGSFATHGDLESLEKLQAVLAELEGYRKNDPLIMYRMGLFQGKALYPIACKAYSNKFRTLLLHPLQQNITAKLSALPITPAAGDEYGATYYPLKTYIITASDPNPDSAQDTVDYLPTALLSEWEGSATPDPAVAQLAKAQFTFYANMLGGSSSCLADAGRPENEDLIARAQTRLNGFQGFEHVYQSMIAAANHKFPQIDFNSKFPGSQKYIVDTFPIPGAFTKDGFAFMEAAIRNPNQYLGGEDWVLGRRFETKSDPATLSPALKKEYYDDFIKTWRTFLASARFSPNPLAYRDFNDAADKLSALDVDSSPLLELFSIISFNTAVDALEVSSAFAAPQKVVLPSSPDKPLISDTNRKYMTDLRGLQAQLKGIALDSTKSADPNAGQNVILAAVTAEQDVNDLRSSFGRDPDAGMSDKSYELLIAPIKASETLANLAHIQAAGGRAKQFCSQLLPLLNKFPFNPGSVNEATAEEVTRMFGTGGEFANFVTSPPIRGIVGLQGSQFVPSNPKPPLNPAFIAFLNRAQQISSTLVATGNQPSLDFTLTEVKSPGVPDAVLNIDGQQITSAGQSMTFHWISKPDSHYSLSSKGNSSAPPPSPWSVFRLGFAATHIQPDRLKYNLQLNNQTNGIVLFDASGGGAALLNPDFMRSFHCVSNVAH